MLKPTKENTERRGRPLNAPTRITATIREPFAQAVLKLAAEAHTTPSAYVAHLVERCVMNDPEVLANDTVALRLETELKQQFGIFMHRFGEAMLRDLHETVATREMLLRQIATAVGTENAKRSHQECWALAVEELQVTTKRARGHE